MKEWILPCGIFLVAVLLFLLLRKRETGFRIPKSGEMTGTVIGVSRGLKRENEEKNTYHLIVEVTDEKGHTERLSSKELDFYPGNDLKGKKVTVRFPNRQLNDYEMEIERIL